MKIFKPSRKAIVISLVSIATLLAIDLTLIAVGFFVTGNNMARFESNPQIEMQVSLSNAMADVRILNHSEDEYQFGTPFTLYRRFGWRWRRVFFQNELTEGVPWHSIGFAASPSSYADRPPIDLYHHFGTLPSGEYRIVIEVFLSTTGPRSESIRIAGTFIMP